MPRQTMTAAARRALRLRDQKKRDRKKRNKTTAAAPLPTPLAVSPKEFGRLTGIGMTTVWKGIYAGEIKSTLFGPRKRLIPYSEALRICGLAG